MSKKTISLNLNEETIREIDGLAKKMGISRSKFCEITLSTAVGGRSLREFTMWLFSDKEEREEKQSDLVTA